MPHPDELEPAPSGTSGAEDSTGRSRLEESVQQIRQLNTTLQEAAKHSLEPHLQKAAQQAAQALSDKLQNDVLPQVNALTRAVTESAGHGQLTRSVNALDAQFTESVRAIVDSDAFANAIAALHRAGPLREQIDELDPPNWDSSITNVVMLPKLAEQEGLPVVWVPRAEVLEELTIASDETSRRQILASRYLEVSEDCTAVLQEAQDGEFGELVTLADAATQCLGMGQFWPAQATATAALDSLLHRLEARRPPFLTANEKSVYSTFKKSITPLSEDALLGWLRTGCTLAALPQALGFFKFGVSPVPVHYNRHASAHQAGAVQYSAANAVIAVMLVVSLLCEAHEAGW